MTENMNPMAKHAKFTTGQAWLAGAFVVLGFALTPIAFIVMLFTVMHLLEPSLHGWAWSVPVATEAGFLAFFCADLLAESKRRPLKALRVAPWVFAVVSLALNVLAAAGNMPAMLGHAVAPLLFFGYVLVAEWLVRRLAVSEEEEQVKAAVAHAVTYATDLLREQFGWRWSRRCPAVLRQQLRAGRVPAAVRAAAENAARYGQHDSLEAAAQEWVVDALTRADRLAAQVKAKGRQVQREAQAAAAAEAQAQAATSGVRAPASRRRKSPRARPASAGRQPDIGTKAEAMLLLADNPRLSGSELGRALGLSPQRGRQIKTELAMTAPQSGAVESVSG